MDTPEIIQQMNKNNELPNIKLIIVSLLKFMIIKNRYNNKNNAGKHNII